MLIHLRCNNNGNKIAQWDGNEMTKQWSSLPKYFISSASRKTGINEILGHINKMNNFN